MKKLTIVTGAGSGIGKEFALQLSQRLTSTDDELWLLARSQDKLQAVKTQIQSEKPYLTVKCIPLDLTGTSGAGKFNSILAEFKKNEDFTIACLVNNAGFGTYGPFSDTPLSEQLSMIELNCTSLTGLCGHAIEYMGPGSRIINVSSLAAFMPLGNFAVYAATKAYVLSFSVALAAELKERGISVTALCPGSVSTNFANVASNGARKEVLHGKDPGKVVAHCIKKAFRDKKIVLYAPKWKFTAFLSRFTGRYLVARFTYLFNKRPRAD